MEENPEIWVHRNPIEKGVKLNGKQVNTAIESCSEMNAELSVDSQPPHHGDVFLLLG
jgi:hypothetical protein